MIALLLYLLFYVGVPYVAYRVVWHWTGSSVASWAAAVVTVPVGVFLYIRWFEYLRHGSRPHKLPADRTPSGKCD